MKIDVIVIGAGIVGLATAYKLLQSFPDLRLVLLDKEQRVAEHQSGRNSGVLHSGIYYRPGSLKARLCRSGRKEMLELCAALGVPVRICGKLIVATSQLERPAFERLLRRGRENGVRAEPISAAQMREVEPEARGVAAIQVSETAVLDFADVCRGLAHRLQQSGASIVLTARVSGIVQRSGSVVIETSAGAFEARAAVNCAGLQSDRIARSSGARLEHRIVPFRGDYYELVGRARALVRGLIYPVPDVRFPFLGVHFTRRIDDRVECGPNAVLALGREAYEEGQLDVGDLLEALTYPGFLKLALRHARIGLGEALRSASKRSFVAALQRLVPAVQSTHLAPAGCGIRAQAIGRDGTPIDDFLIIEVGRVVNVCNAPSPAATASLAIGALIAERVGSLVIEAAIRRV